jgi:hypothetical protein
LLPDGIYDATLRKLKYSTLYSICFTLDNKVMIEGTLILFRDSIVLLESSYVQIVLFGMVHFGKTGLHLATIVFNDDFPSLTTVNACSCQISAGKTVTVPVGNTLSIFDYSGLGTLVLENSASFISRK